MHTLICFMHIPYYDTEYYKYGYDFCCWIFVGGCCLSDSSCPVVIVSLLLLLVAGYFVASFVVGLFVGLSELYSGSVFLLDN